jgi:hypothetical protein
MSIIKDISDFLNITAEESEKILEKSISGGEITDSFNERDWFEQRFKPNVVFIDETGYTKMCVDALKIIGTTAATDYGSSRQRDLVQLWADMTRGYLGEYAFKKFLKDKLGIDSELGHEVGNLNDYLPMDIHLIKDKYGKYRPPNISIGVKTTKWNGIWLDIPGDQFNHSHVHVLVKVGTGRDHLIAFFKMISVFRDKVLEKGKSVGALTKEESEDIFRKLPDFKIIPAYICGFVIKDSEYKELDYTGRKGKKNYTILTWKGPILPGDLKRIEEKEKVIGTIKFEGIGSFAHDRGYLFNAGNLLWKKSDWEMVKKKI